MKHLAVSGVALLISFRIGHAGDFEPKGEIIPQHYICYRTAGSITIDGKADEPSWRLAPWTQDFVDIEGTLKPKPRFRTRVKMLWDDEYFYVTAELEEPDVWATIKERDAVIYHDNDFEVFIDPDGDTHQYYEFEMNALNTVWDLLLITPYRDGGPAVTGWDISGLKTAVYVNGTLNQPDDRDQGWSVELAFPWRALRECAHRPTPPNNGDQWRVNFSRVEYQVDKVNGKYKKKKGLREDNWVWSPQGLINMHYPEMWGYVQFSAKVVGTAQDTFITYPQEEAKAALRKIYYREKQYYQKHKHYTSRLIDLGIEDPGLRHYQWPPKLQVTDSLFEAVIVEKEDVDHDGKLSRWHIRQDSKTWKD